MASRPIYQFYAELDGYSPKIWRRFQVRDNITAARLAYINMTLFEMQASHLFSFELREENSDILKLFMIPDEESDIWNENVKQFDATGIKISAMVPVVKTRFRFVYDFGDDWGVLMTLEDIITDEDLPSGELPRVLGGAGFGIVEDCGGIPGLENLAKAFKKKRGKEYKELREWLGVDDFDLTAFDIDDMNFRLKKIPRIYARIYERGIGPTRQSIDLLERKYLKK
ncbi:MAG: plasmid pRiA4b ORF-3 family protein [Synergistaceae bacterium]|jgi:hypothetical protein|nr:plasmid pRiA4b ORF-3 family protein [Synergistaceae bacterium]